MDLQAKSYIMTYQAKEILLSKYYNIDDLRLLAKRRVPQAVFDYADGAAEDELTKKNNRNAYRKWKLIPDALIDVADIDTETEVLGTKMPYPFALGPTAISYLFHHSGEPAVARAASKRNFPSTLSSIASTNIEDYADASDGSVWYQMYVWKNREISYDFIKRCKEKKYKAIMLTVDVPVGGKRERDLRSGMTVPPRLTLASIIDAAFHPTWWWNFIFGPKRLAIPHIWTLAETVHNSAWSTPQTLLVSSERLDRHESKNTIISSGGVDSTELRMLLGGAHDVSSLGFFSFDEFLCESVGLFCGEVPIRRIGRLCLSIS